MKTNVAQTSLEAYWDVKKSTQGAQHVAIMGYLERNRQWEDYSRRELSVALEIDLNAICGRVNELIKSGEIVECEPRPCRVSGRRINPVRRKG